MKSKDAWSGRNKFNRFIMGISLTIFVSFI